MGTTKGTVLVVDDNKQIQELIQAILEEEGYRVLRSIDGASLARQTRRNPESLLPTSGCRTWRVRRSPNACGPIPPRHTFRLWPCRPIGISQNHLSHLPVDDRLAKPFELDVLLALVARWIPAAHS